MDYFLKEIADLVFVIYLYYILYIVTFYYNYYIESTNCFYYSYDNINLKRSLILMLFKGKTELLTGIVSCLIGVESVSCEYINSYSLLSLEK